MRDDWVGAVPAPPGEGCTGIAASWCPIHGDCTCPRDEDGGLDFDGLGCPLHSDMTDHPEPGYSQGGTR